MPKLLYYFHGYLSDKIDPNDKTKCISSPDGNFSYSWSIIQEFQKRGWEVYCLVDRDKEIVKTYGQDAFKSFAMKKRFEMYKNIKFIENINNLPEVDLVLNEWRFQTRDNQKQPNEEGYSPDLFYQNKIIDFYKGKTKIVVFDLDYKFTEQDEEYVKPWKVLETALYPKRNHTSVYIPFDFTQMFEFSTLNFNKDKMLVYIGNNYERDFDFNNKIVPISKMFPDKVHLVGNWLKDSAKDFRDNNPQIQFHGRIGATEFRELYGNSLAVPLLAKEEYKEKGYVTMRILESLLFGSIPIGFSDFEGIDLFLPKELIIDMNNFEYSSKKVFDYLLSLNYIDRVELRKKLIRNLRFMDAENFVNKLLEEQK